MADSEPPEHVLTLWSPEVAVLQLGVDGFEVVFRMVFVGDWERRDLGVVPLEVLLRGDFVVYEIPEQGVALLPYIDLVALLEVVDPGG